MKPTDPRTGEILSIDLPDEAQMDFVWIDPGTFLMGSPDSEEGRFADEGPQHEVTISKGFYLGQFVVTQAQWESVMGPPPWAEKEQVQSNPAHPAVYISWGDTQAFILRLNDTAGEELYRLPTEAEWEYACRAGTITSWSFGEDESQLGDHAWYRDNAWDVELDYGQPVGAKLPNPWGLFDMHGNVYEWCQDWLGWYSTDSLVDPTGLSTGPYRVFRGGSFYSPAPGSVRSAMRGRDTPGLRDFYLGVRLLRTE